MTRVRPGWDPPSHNAPGLYAYGAEFNVLAPRVANGVWWYQADGPGGVADVSVFMYDAAEEILATGFALASAIALGWNLITYTSPPLLPIGDGYVWTAEQDGEASYDGSDPPYPYNSPDDAITVVQGRYQSGGGFPDSTWTGQHGTDLDTSPPDDPAVGAADLGIDFALAATGRSARAGVGAHGLALQLAAAGRSPRAGTANQGLSFALAAAGRRDSTGVANLGLTFALAATGRAPARGTANFPLTLRLGAVGPTAEVVPGTLVPGGSAAALTAGGITPTLTAS